MEQAVAGGREFHLQTEIHSTLSGCCTSVDWMRMGPDDSMTFSNSQFLQIKNEMTKELRLRSLVPLFVTTNKSGCSVTKFGLSGSCLAFHVWGTIPLCPLVKWDPPEREWSQDTRDQWIWQETKGERRKTEKREGEAREGGKGSLSNREGRFVVHCASRVA